MPLDEIGRRYADRLLTKSFEEIVAKQQHDLADIRADHSKRNMLMSGSYITACARVYLEQISRLAEALKDSLLKAYEKAGFAFDDTALAEIKAEVMEFCHQKQHNALGAISQLVNQTFGGQQAANIETLRRAAATDVTRGVDSIMSRLGLDLLIKRDEIILDEMKARKVYAAGLGKQWDIFICHASEDKEGFVRPLAISLQQSGLFVWYDEFSLRIGDSLRRKIDEGLANSRYGAVVLSPAFFEKNWPQHELDGLVSKEIAGGTKVVLPIWHNITFEEVQHRSPTLAGKVAARSGDGVETVVKRLREAMGL